MKCDLHIHSNKSDGKYSPTEIVNKAIGKGLQCIALCDHDTVSGVKEAQCVAEVDNRIKVIAGIEISTIHAGRDVHILSYNIDYNNDNFLADLQEIKQLRELRNVKMIEKLNEFGLGLDLDEIKSRNMDKSIGRALFAQELVTKGCVSSKAEAFEKYLGTEGLAYVTTRRLTPVEAIQLSLKYGGIPVLAHPKNLGMSKSEFCSFLRPLVLAGLGGIEAMYFSHTSVERRFYFKQARNFNLIATGGSDYHDETHGHELGEFFSPTNYTKKFLGL
ncbi:MAG: PHP domain-containing protein [Clostridia bacterium]